MRSAARTAWAAVVVCATLAASAATANAADPGSTQSFTYGTGPLANPYLVYTPTTYDGRRPAPLVVMVHGCQTSAEQQMRANLFNGLAERYGFVVLYPDIDASGGLQPGPTVNCWRFFAPTSWSRGGGDATAIAGMTRAVMSRRSIDPERVYLAGMSAGGFMTSILAAAYPDLYAAVAIAAGGAYGDSSCLFGAPGALTAEQSAQLAFGQMGPRARVVPLLVMGGDKDGAVSAACADKALEQGLRTDNLVLGGTQTGPIPLQPASSSEEQQPGGYSYTVSSYAYPPGCTIARRMLIHGMDHFWPGGSADPQWAPWTDAKAPSGAEAAWAFVSRFRRSTTGRACSAARGSTRQRTRVDSEPFEINVTNGLGAGEPELALDPVHHTIVIAFDYINPPAGSETDQGCGIAISADAGVTWQLRLEHPADPGPTPGVPYHRCSDPAAASGPGGALYSGAGWWDTPGGAVDYYNMYVSTSTDGGFTWGPSVFATGDRDIVANLLLGKNSGHTDREFLAADNRTGTLYVSAADFPRVQRWVVASHDQGRTFGPLHAIDSADAPQVPPNDSIPAAANGVLAVSYLTPTASGGGSCPCGIFETSEDDGATWTRHRAPIPAQWTAADPAHPGRFAIMSGQGPSDLSSTPTVLVVSVTSDSGRTWSAPVQIGQAPPNQRTKPWIAYSPTGVLGVAYRTIYSDNSYDFWAAIARDGGHSFDAPVRISHARSAQAPEGGDDFSHVALDADYLYATWADMRKAPGGPAGAVRSLYLGRVALGAPTAVAKLLSCRRVRARRRRYSCNARAVSPAYPVGRFSARATLVRGRTVYATGRSARTRRGRLRLLVTESQPLRPGRYALTLRGSRRGHRVIRRLPITVR